jgi:CRISPR-associated protein Csm1
MIIENKSILVKGDVSGIQEFIFNVKSDKAAQELKGRSFFIKVLVEVAIQYLLDQFGIVDPNEIKDCKISTSGGNFILKLPTVADYETIIKKARQDFTKTLEFTGLNLSILPVIEKSQKTRYKEAALKARNVINRS